MASARSIPSHLKRLLRSVIEKPCSFSCFVAVGRLPYLASPISRALNPLSGFWSEQIELFPSVAECRMLKNATPLANGGERSGKASAIILRSVVLTTPTREIDMRESRPKLTRGMCHNRIRAGIGSRVSRLVPRLDIRPAQIAAPGFDVEGGA